MFQQSMFAPAKAVGRFAAPKARQHTLFAVEPIEAAQVKREALPGQTSFLDAVGSPPASPPLSDPIAAADPTVKPLSLPAPARVLALPAPYCPPAVDPRDSEIRCTRYELKAAIRRHAEMKANRHVNSSDDLHRSRARIARLKARLARLDAPVASGR